MIFDSDRMKQLLKVYDNEPDFLVPEIVFLARTEKLEYERRYLEELFWKSPESKHNDWLGRLLNVDHDQFRSAWFEIMLYGWLKKIGNTEVEPAIEGNYPDYSIELKGQKIILEAKAILETEAEREQMRFEAGIFWALKRIERPFTVEIAASCSSSLPDWIDFQQRVTHWLDTSPNDVFEYKDECSDIVLKAIQIGSTSNKTVQAFTNTGFSRNITSKPIKRPLREKAHQHSNLRKASYPYIVALYLESWYLTAEEVVRAWLGEEVWTVDFEKNEVVETYSDRSGIHFAGSEIRHKTVSGTLVFKSEWTEFEKCSFLRAWYVENPFAQVPLDTMLFPVEARYVVTDKSSKGFRMAWAKS